jgi:CRISPR-associated endonuclease Csn1
MEAKNYILGLDLGTTSVGWSVLEADDVGEPCGIIDAGSRIFHIAAKVEKNTEKPGAEDRRMARGARRLKQRRRMRKTHLRNLLVRSGFWPATEAEWDAIRAATNPYDLRVRGLDEKLTPHEFARALYHLAQRRGFKSNRKDNRKTDAESGKVKSAISELSARMKEAEARSLAHYLVAVERPAGNRFRKRWTAREMYEHEFGLLWSKQAEFHPALTDDLRAQVHHAIFHQRPLKPKEADEIGFCEYERWIDRASGRWDGERRAPRHHWLVQHFRLLKEINNLEIYDQKGPRHDTVTGEVSARLTDRERTIARSLLSTHKEVSFDKLRKALGLLEHQRFNLEESRAGSKTRTKLKGNVAEVEIIAAFGDKPWAALTEDQRGEVRDRLGALQYEDDEDRFVEWLVTTHGLDRSKADDLTGYGADTPGYASYSLKLLRNIVPHLEGGKDEHDALVACGYTKPQLPQRDDLPPVPKLRNPVVERTLTETRKVVNALIRRYGKPTFIHVEMARDAKKTRDERNEVLSENRKREARREQVAAKIREHGIAQVSRDDIEKWELWEEQKGQCPYTGQAIAVHQLLSEQTEVDHILPYSRTLNDGRMNKVVVYRDANRAKGNHTPYEWKHGTPDWEPMLQRIRELPFPKRKKFIQKEVELEDFIARQLNDTRYITKEVCGYLEQLYPEHERALIKGGKRRVVPSRGELTAEMRWQWGLNRLLNPEGENWKNRDDHRHHALDAIVIALTNHKAIKAQSQASKYSQTRVQMPRPWGATEHAFERSIEDALRRINVSHRVDHRVRGQLHEETNYGGPALRAARAEQGAQRSNKPPRAHEDLRARRKAATAGRYFYTVALQGMSAAKIEKIVDDTIRRLAIARCAEHGIDVSKGGSAALPTKVFETPLYLTTKAGQKVPIHTVRIEAAIDGPTLLADAHGLPYRAVKTGSNHHVEIYETADKKGRAVLRAKVVSLFEAQRRAACETARLKAARGKLGRPLTEIEQTMPPVIQTNHGEGTRFVMWLANGDSVLLNGADGQERLCTVQKMSATDNFVYACFRLATDATERSKTPEFARIVSSGAWTAANVRKVEVGPLGQVRVLP